MPQEWSKEMVVRSIVERHRLGRKISQKYIRTKYPSLYRAGRRFYGNWKSVIEATGIDYSEVHERGKEELWTEKKVVKEIRRLHKAREPINSRHISLNYGPLYGAAYSRFGGWAQAIEAAGIDYSKIRKYGERWTRQRVIDEIQKRRREGLPLNEWEAGPRLTSPARRIFGSWLNAIHAAGLTWSQIKKGRSRKRGWWTRNRVLMRLRQLEAQGVRLNLQNIKKIDKPVLWNAWFYFGSWDQALEAAGISYRDHYVNWSTKAWLRHMKEGEYHETVESSKIHAKKRSAKK
ncbi:hypothetical protein HY418_02605 [Candidatus Kaiserbacteria bacterium]|nr:hypothetical protein [Candidatus Kaiserbacteria bacterium]